MEEQKTDITVIDAIMGSGKTSWAIQYMNERPEYNFIYITPFLTEINRVCNNANVYIYEPKNTGNGKLENLNELIEKQYNIATTHALFARISEETRTLLQEAHYILILDEVLDVIAPYNETKRNDIKFLIENDCVTIDEDGYLIWNDDKNCNETQYENIQLLAKNKSLVYINNTLLLWQFPVNTFSLFDEIYIMTYMFDGQIMKYYYDYHKIKYTYKSIQKKSEDYYLCDYNPDSENRSKYIPLINIFDDPVLNEIGEDNKALSKNWYENKNKSECIKQLKNNLTNYFKHKLNAPSSTISWSVYADFEKKLSGKGRTYVKKLDAEEKGLPDEDKRQYKCFVPCNSRATNMYADRFNLAYAVNLFINPYIMKFFIQRGIIVNQEKFALCEMLQWIWRSRIRNGYDINIYIPSRRMRNLLTWWLNSK